MSELKEDLNFNLLLTKDLKQDILNLNYNVLLIDAGLVDKHNYEYINNLKKKKLLISKSNDFKGINYDEQLSLPLYFLDLNKKLRNLIISSEFVKNSSIEIKGYVLDKNEKKLSKNKNHIVITEKEIQLIEALFASKNALKKNKILEIVWKYSDDADTHTVETHIYRLRKKISNKFKEDNFIINSKEGYLI